MCNEKFYCLNSAYEKILHRILYQCGTALIKREKCHADVMAENTTANISRCMVQIKYCAIII